MSWGESPQQPDPAHEPSDASVEPSIEASVESEAVLPVEPHAEPQTAETEPQVANVEPQAGPAVQPWGALGATDPAAGAPPAQFGMPPQQFDGYPPGYPGTPGYQGYPGAPAPKRSKNGLFVGLAVLALVLVGGGVWAVNNGGVANSDASDAPTIQISVPPIGQFLQQTPDAPATTTPPPAPMALPASAGGLTLLTSSSAQKAAATLRTSLTKSGDAYQNALIGGYGPTASGNSRMFLVAQPFANLDPADQTQFESTNAAYLLTQLTSVMNLAGQTTETSTDPGAAISCGTLTASGHDVLLCVWVDTESFGVGYFYNTFYTTSMSDAATYTDALRAAAEGS